MLACCGESESVIRFDESSVARQLSHWNDALDAPGAAQTENKSLDLEQQRSISVVKLRSGSTIARSPAAAIYDSVLYMIVAA